MPFAFERRAWTRCPRNGGDADTVCRSPLLAVAARHRDKSRVLLGELLHDLPVRGQVPTGAWVDSITVDEREVTPGSLFIARRGYYGDGHDRIAAALAAGACALLVEDRARVPAGTSVPVLVAGDDPSLLGRLSARFYRHPTRSLTVYGVTGTNGKTSVTYLLEHLLATLGERPAVMGTVSYRYERRSHPACNTTPDAIFVHRFARRALDAGARSLVLEVSSHALALGRVAEVRFARAGFTNLSHEHLDFHRTLDEYRRTKERLFAEGLLATGAAGPTPIAAALVDDQTGWGMLRAAPRGVRRIAVSVAAEPPSHHADATGAAGPLGAGGATSAALTDVEWARVAAVEPRGLCGYRFEVETGAGRWLGQTSLLGRHNLANIALALALAASGDSERMAAAVRAIESFQGIPGRLEPVAPAESAPRAVFVDYAHTPEAVRRALETFDEVGAAPVTVVLGCGGDRDRSKRAPMARAARLGADRVILTNDNPRSEEPGSITEPMLAAFAEPEPLARARSVDCELDRAVAIERAVSDQGHGPVLIAGKGHERYQERGGRRYRFDDREQARRALAALALGHAAARLPIWCGWSLERLRSECGATVQAAHPTRAGLPILSVRIEAAARAGTEASADEARAVTLSAPRVMPGLAPTGCAVVRLVSLDPWHAVRALARAVVAEAAVSVGGLWILGVSGAPSEPVEPEPLARLVGTLRALRPHEPVRAIASARSSAGGAGEPSRTALVTMACLTPADRGVVLAWPSAYAASGGAAAAEPGGATPEAPIEPVDTIALDAALGLDAGGWEARLARARERTRLRFEAGFEPRPIPVPESLRLDP